MGEQVGFHVRYFELEPGGFTSLEHHHHAHVVIAMTGRGIVRVGNHRHKIAPFDTVYIRPDEPHQLRAGRNEKFGFLCIVNARRDRPRPVA
jgi:ribulose-bisphosphate carboxylase large chain